MAGPNLSIIVKGDVSAELHHAVQLLKRHTQVKNLIQAMATFSAQWRHQLEIKPSTRIRTKCKQC